MLARVGQGDTAFPERSMPYVLNAVTGTPEAALLGAHAAGLLSFDDITGPLAPPASLAAEPDPVMTAFHAERHARFRHIVPALRLTGKLTGEGAV